MDIKHSSETAAVPASTTTRIGSIDSLRCLAMTAVVAQHCGLLPFGWTGVWLFFVISGYVVTLTVIGKPRSRCGLTQFFRRRSLRIVPIYYGYVGVGLAFLLATGSAIDPVAAGSLVGFVNNAAMIAGRGELSGWPVGHLWTISSEMQFYLLYGVAMFTLRDRAVMALLVAAVLLSPVLRLTAVMALDAAAGSAEVRAYAIYAGPGLHFDAFAAGGLLAFASRSGALERMARPLALAGCLILATYVAAYVWLNHALLGARGIDMLRNVLSGVLWGQLRAVFAYSALTMAFAGLVALAATQDRWVDWLLRFRLLRRIGEVSYGAYVYHALAIVVAVELLSPLLAAHSGPRPFELRLVLFLVSYSLACCAAEASYRWLERRFIDAGRSQRTLATAAAAQNARSSKRAKVQMPTTIG